MTNHAHLQAMAKDIPFGGLLKPLLTSHAMYMNRKYGYRGHLFQDRFTSIEIHSEEAACYTLRYIHLNPVRARLVETPAEWRWTSHRAYADPGAALPGLDTAILLSWFSEDESAARARYCRFTDQEVQPAEGLDPYGLDGMASKMERERGLNAGEIQSHRVNGPLTQLRKRFIDEALGRGFKPSAIADFLGRSRSAVHYACRSGTH